MPIKSRSTLELILKCYFSGTPPYHCPLNTTTSLCPNLKLSHFLFTNLVQILLALSVLYVTNTTDIFLPNRGRINGDFTSKLTNLLFCSGCVPYMQSRNGFCKLAENERDTNHKLIVTDITNCKRLDVSNITNASIYA